MFDGNMMVVTLRECILIYLQERLPQEVLDQCKAGDVELSACPYSLDWIIRVNFSYMDVEFSYSKRLKDAAKVSSMESMKLLVWNLASGMRRTVRENYPPSR